MASTLYPPPLKSQIQGPSGRASKDYADWFLATQTSVIQGAAPSDATFWTSSSNGTLTSETNLGLLVSGYLKITVASATATPSTVAKVPGADVSHDVVSKAFADSGFTASADQTVLVDATGGATTINLPATPTKGIFVIVKKTDASANAVTVNGNGNTIDGAATQALPAQWNAFTMQGSGAAYFITGAL